MITIRPKHGTFYDGTAALNSYQEKSLLRLLECYVLWTIDHLPEVEAANLKEMTPKLQTVYGVQGDWQQVIANAAQLPSNLPALTKDLWRKNTEIARRNGTILTPLQFAEMFVDQNLI